MARGQRRRRGHVPARDVRPLDPHPAASVLDQMTGHQMPGGCDDCTAYQTLDRHVTGVYLLVVHHDDTCPAYRALPRSTP